MITLTDKDFNSDHEFINESYFNSDTKRYEFNDDLTVKQAEAILNHELNLVTTCSLKCNDAQNIFFKPVERDELIKQILEEVVYESIQSI